MGRNRCFWKPLMGILLIAMLGTSCNWREGRLKTIGAGTVTSESLKTPTAYDVISWAHLDDKIKNHLEDLVPGEADGKSIIGEYVMVLNGNEMFDFVKAHGYRSFLGPIEVRKQERAIEVDVKIIGADGATIIITLFADGGMMGIG